MSLSPQQRLVTTIIRNQGKASRSDIARLLGLSRASMTQLISGLMERGLVMEVGDGDSQGGRRPRLLSFNDKLGYVVGVDVGATSLDVAIADFNGKIIAQHGEAVDVREGPQAILGRVNHIAQSLLALVDAQPSQVYGFGIGVPGPVEFTTGLLIAPPIMPGWNGFPIRDFIGQTFQQARVMVDNDVNVMALGELRVGAGKDVQHFVFVKIGTGIGAGIVANGVMYRGHNGSAGDIGHVCADVNGLVCHCGNIGCLEAMAAGPAIAARALKAAQSGASDFLAQRLQAQGILTAADVSRGIMVGDYACNEIIQDCGRLIGEALASMVNILNPSMIFIGGGVSNVGFQLLAAIRQAVLRRSPPLATKDLRIDYASLGANAGIHGAVALALEHVFKVLE